MGRTLLTSAVVGMAAAVILCSLMVHQGCGTSALPIALDIGLTRDDGSSDDLQLRGLSDPGASSFADGLLLYTRWQPEEADGATSYEWMLDLDVAAVQKRLESSSLPLTLREDEFELHLTLRQAQGARLADATVSSGSVVLWGWEMEPTRDLHRGQARATLGGDTKVTAFVVEWATVPPPGKGSTIPQAGDSVSGGDMVTSGDTTPAGGDDPLAQHGDNEWQNYNPDTGCDCEDSEDRDEPPPTYDDGSGCQGDDTENDTASGGCQGDDGDDAGDTTTSGGCEGDDGDDTETSDEGDDTTSSESGCEGDDPEPTELARATHGHRAQRPWRVPLEWSPLLLVALLRRIRYK